MSEANGTIVGEGRAIGLRGAEPPEQAPVVRPSIPPGPMGGPAAAQGGGGCAAPASAPPALSLSVSAEVVDALAIKQCVAHLESLGLAIVDPATFFRRLVVLRRADGGVRVLLPEG